ncbi:carbohydrate sulfotransferase 9-like [Babylonia areolata]|uniref:carbohydrate sulfotransferase 9-like n=1 Tax=Babylonia areolata TaxID=304850 RepID=UPI003FD4828D
MLLFFVKHNRKRLALAVVAVFAIASYRILSQSPVLRRFLTFPGIQEAGKAVAHEEDRSSNLKTAPQSWGQGMDPRLRGVCNASRGSGKVFSVFLNQQHLLAYCLVPKTGCTFWKRVFAFLNKDIHLNLLARSPLHIPRLYVHRVLDSGHGKAWSRVKDSVKGYFRFMFSRDPYSRLWSSYLDKYYLPDFWLRFPVHAHSRNKSRASGTAVSCGNNVTFPEFIEYSLRVQEPHWNAISSLCDPCVFRPNLLGSMETFARDARVVLDKAGLGWILDDSMHAQNEIKTLIDYNFSILKSYKKLQMCITEERLGFRLWKTFQYNGYISDTISYQPPSPFTLESFLSLVLEACARSVKMGAELLKEQKRKALDNAFKQLSLHTLQRIAAKYDLDFKIFGYKPRYFNE